MGQAFWPNVAPPLLGGWTKRVQVPERPAKSAHDALQLQYSLFLPDLFFPV
jgi:hypothetical protein